MSSATEELISTPERAWRAAHPQGAQQTVRMRGQQAEVVAAAVDAREGQPVGLQVAVHGRRGHVRHHADPAAGPVQGADQGEGAVRGGRVGHGTQLQVVEPGPQQRAEPVVGEGAQQVQRMRERLPAGVLATGSGRPASASCGSR